MTPRRGSVDPTQLEDLLTPYNPWWEGGVDAVRDLPWFRRPVFDRILEDILGLKQIVSITGPRRVGKTTLVRQVIAELLRRGIEPRKVLYFSMDDPLMLRDPYRERFFDLLVERTGGRATSSPITYVFLDEIQRHDRWELFLKKYYDLGFPLRFVISGSASSPIFKKSRESLLGRVKDFHVLPFSFREYVLFRSRGDDAVREFVGGASEHGRALRDALVTEWTAVPSLGRILEPPHSVAERIKGHLQDYMVEGGFPEVWELPDLVRKQEYLFDNQVQKVIFEDLVLATEFRKPENIKSFYLSLIEQPGRELNLEKASAEIGVSRPMLEKYFPLLEMTDLVKRLPKFSRRVLKVRRGNVKCYLVDLALRNAILKLGRKVLDDPVAVGQYAENLAFNVLSKWPGIVSLAYYREKQREVDFVVTLGGGRYLAVEVKYRKTIDDLGGLRAFMDQNPQSYALIVGREQAVSLDPRQLMMPLHHFLLAFD